MNKLDNTEKAVLAGILIGFSIFMIILGVCFGIIIEEVGKS